MGEIQVICGPMFSGKSTELIRRIRRYTIVGHTCILIKHSFDTRYSKEDVSTHDRITWTAVSTSSLASVDISSADVIGIDEGQFFPDLVSTVEKMANAGKIVVVAALDGTFQRTPFPGMAGLFSIAESVTKLTAVCMGCHAREASFTKRLGTETEEVIIGGSEKYMAVCRGCYF